jgi:hypothetical protein
LIQWPTAARLTPNAAALSFCHPPASDNSQARWRRHWPTSARFFDVFMALSARTIHAFTPGSLNAQERSAFSRYAANARWHPLETRLQRERAEEIARVVKQAIDDYLPTNKRNLMEPQPSASSNRH